MEKSARLSLFLIAIGLLQTLEPAEVAAASLQGHFYPFGTGQGDSLLQHSSLAGSSSQTPPLQVGVFNYYGRSYSSLIVDSNGVLILQSSGPIQHIPEAFPATNKVLIAPFWANAAYNVSHSKVYYRIDSSETLLLRMTNDLRAIINQEPVIFSKIVVVTWVELRSETDHLSTNTFQCILGISSSMAYVLFQYADNLMNWAGEPSPALVGFNAGDGTNAFVLPTSLSADILQVASTGNTGTDGRWLFRVDGSQVTFPGAIIGFSDKEVITPESEHVTVCAALLAGTLSRDVFLIPEGQHFSTDDEDFSTRVGVFTFRSDSNVSDTVCKNIIIDNDVKYEINEKFSIYFATSSQELIAFLPQKMTITIIDDDSVIVTYNSVNAIEEHNRATIPVNLVMPDTGVSLCSSSNYMTQREVQVSYAVFDGDAKDGIDYFGHNGTVTVRARMCSGTFTVALNDDEIYEEKEHFSYVIRSSDPNIIVDPTHSSADVFIRDNDGPKVIVGLTQEEYTVTEGERAQICVEMTAGAISQPVTVTIRIGYSHPSIIVATENQDYLALLENVTFVPSRPREIICVNFTTLNDNIYEGMESSVIILMSSSDITLQPSTTVVRILDSDNVTVRIASDSYMYQEGASNRRLEVCANLTGEIERSLSIQVTASEGSATFYHIDNLRDGDFISDIDDIVFDIPDTLPSGLGQTCSPQCVACTQITIQNDQVLEEHYENFSLVLSHQDPAVHFISTSATVTIVDTDRVQVTIQDFAHFNLELREDEVVMSRLCLEREGLSDVDVGVRIATRSQSATSTVDYIVDSRSITIPASRKQRDDKCGNVILTMLNDLIVEGNETMVIFVESTDPTRVSVVNGNSLEDRTLTILDDDSVSVNFLQSSFSASEGEGEIQVCLQMTGFSAIPLTVVLTPWPGTAKAEVDYKPQPISIQLPPTDQALLNATYNLSVPDRLLVPLPVSPSICANLSIVNDDTVESEISKFLHLNISHGNPLVIAPPLAATLTIEDDDSLSVQLEVTHNTTVTEGGSVLICVKMLGRADFAINATVRPVAVLGSAQGGVDFAGAELAVQFPAFNSEHRCVHIQTLDDSAVEREEMFQVELTLVEESSRVTLGANHSINITIVDNDFVEVGFERADYSIVEGEGSVEVCANMTGRLDKPVAVIFSVLDPPGRNQGDTDYVPIPTLPFFETPSSNFYRRECVNISISNDTILEDTERFQVALTSSDAKVRIVQGVSTVYIIDDDSVRVSLEERRVTVFEREGLGSSAVCVSLVGRIQQHIEVTLETQPSSAKSGSDYLPIATTLTFDQTIVPEQQQCVSVSVIDDATFEEDEHFVVLLRVQHAAVSIHISQMEIVIRDDDNVTLSLSDSTERVMEGEGGVSVCVRLSGSTQRNVSYQLDVQAIEAMLDSDFSLNFPSFFTFPNSTETHQTQCHQINIINDKILEGTEHFEIRLRAPEGVARISMGRDHTTVTIDDDDQVMIQFMQTEFSVDEDGSERTVQVCVVLEGEISRQVSATISTQPGTAGLDDFESVKKDVTFVPVDGSRNQIHCFNVSVQADKLVEGDENFSLSMSSSDAAVILSITTAMVTITENDVVCSKISSDTSRGYFSWPETFPEEMAVVKCENGTTTRRCTADGNWEKPQTAGCYISTDQLIRYIEKKGFTKDNLRELLFALLQLLLQNREPSLMHMRAVDSILEEFAKQVEADRIVVDTDIFGVALDIIDIIQRWPANILKDYSSNVIHSQERITVGIFKPEKFSSYYRNLSKTSFFSIKAGKLDLFPQDVQQLKYSFRRNTAGNISTITDEHASGNYSSIVLPRSIIGELQGANVVQLFLSYYDSGAMFPLERNESDKGIGMNVSAVVAASFAGEQLYDLPEDVIVTIHLMTNNYTNVTCVSWDFDAYEGQGGWSEEGCQLVSTDEDVVVCSCNHLTNFACLVDIGARTGSVQPSDDVVLALSILSITGVCVSILGLLLTIITILVFNKLRKKDNTVFRLQLCFAMILMLVSFLVGITRVEIFEVCVAASALIHYFTLASVMWMAAEAMLMFHKLAFVFSRVSTRFLVIVSLFCWLLPIPAVVVPIGLDRTYGISEKYCFISNTIVFFSAFLGPIFAVVLFNFVMFLVVISIVIRHNTKRTKRLKDTSKATKRKGVCRSIFSIIGIMCLLGLTWVFGAFTVKGASEFFQFLFVAFNSLQGFFVFLFFVVFAKETQDLWLQACGCKKKKRRETLSSAVIASESKYMPKSRRMTLDENAERLKALEDIDMEMRKRMNTWDIAYIMPQSQFDVFLLSDAMMQPEEEDELKEPDIVPMKDIERRQAEEVGENMEKSLEERVPSPAVSMDSTQQNALECLSTADSGILMDKVKSTPSPTLPEGDWPQPGRTLCHHIHSVSGIGYVSAESSLETLPQREEDCYVKGKIEPIEIVPQLRTRAIPNEYARLHVEKV